MDDIDAASEGTYERRETPEDAKRAQEAEVKLWLDALALAEKEEVDWRKDAEKVVQRYRGEKDYSSKRYRVLYSNVQTQAPALYNSVPIPDIRRRFGDRDEDAKKISRALERCVSCQAEKGDLDSVMEEMTLHRLLPGRAVTRIRHVREVLDDGYIKESVAFEPVAWDDFRRGPAKRWEDVPWIAFRLYLTRDQIEDLIAEAIGGDDDAARRKAKSEAVSIAQRIPLNATVSGVKKDGESSQPPTVFKRAQVWQFWDKETKSLVYICPDFKEAPVAKLPDTMELEGFYPCPRPMLAIRSPDSLVPVTDYSQYAKLADDLEDITTRLAALVQAAKAKGITAKELQGAFKALEDLDDGELASSDDAFALAQGKGLDGAIWFWPLETIVKAIHELYLAREEVKKALYEVTGLSDIIRGSTKATETATAQREKAQWASARLQRAQADVARFGRDLFRLAVEIIATKFDPKSIMLASGVELTDEQVALMRRDVMREYRIDVETDSTIRADLSRQQENMAGFVQGFASLVAALGPVVQEGSMPKQTAAAILTGFARSFKLGKQAEDALDQLGDLAEKADKQPAKPSPEEMKMQMEGQRMQAQAAMEGQKAQMEAGIRQQEAQADMAAKQQDAQLKAQLAEMDLAMKQREMELREREMQMTLMFKMREHEIRMAELDRQAALGAQQHDSNLEMLAAKTAAAKEAASKPRADA